ncbi:hypothetical protein HYV74_02430 [Candidatus Uhrbacteria bacterium]|nr:hypothetical protein [Candidatus Uhrbacteria bacterium]
MTEHTPYPPFARHLTDWLARAGRTAGDVGEELHVFPETVELWLKGSPPSFNLYPAIKELCGYDFAQWNVEQYVQEMRREWSVPTWNGDRRALGYLDLIQTWTDLQELLEPITKQIPFALLARFMGVHEGTLRSFVALRKPNEKRDYINRGSMGRIVAHLPQLNDFVEGKKLHEISPLSILFERMKLRRLELSLSRTDLANRLRITDPRRITSWEESPESVEIVKPATRRAIAEFLGASLLDAEEREEAPAPDANAEIPSASSGDGGRTEDSSVHVLAAPHAAVVASTSERIASPSPAVPALDPAMPSASQAEDQERRIAVLEQVVLQLLARDADVSRTATVIPASTAHRNGALPHILSKDTFQSLPSGTRWSDEDFAEGKRRIVACREFLLRFLELPEEERLRRAPEYLVDLAELNRLFRAWDSKHPSDVFAQFELERAIEQGRRLGAPSAPHHLPGGRTAVGLPGGRK